MQVATNFLRLKKYTYLQWYKISGRRLGKEGVFLIGFLKQYVVVNSILC